MKTIFAVLLNGIAQIEYDRNKPLPDYQAAYLDKMDKKMDAGILIGTLFFVLLVFAAWSSSISLWATRIRSPSRVASMH